MTPAALKDPAAKARFEAKKKATSARSLYLVGQGKLYRLDRDLTPWAEEYFTTAFIRSKDSMRAVEACTAQATEARRTQILGWVTPYR